MLGTRPFTSTPIARMFDRSYMETEHDVQELFSFLLIAEVGLLAGGLSYNIRDRVEKACMLSWLRMSNAAEEDLCLEFLTPRCERNSLFVTALSISRQTSHDWLVKCTYSYPCLLLSHFLGSWMTIFGRRQKLRYGKKTSDGRGGSGRRVSLRNTTAHILTAIQMGTSGL